HRRRCGGRPLFGRISARRPPHRGRCRQRRARPHAVAPAHRGGDRAGRRSPSEGLTGTEVMLRYLIKLEPDDNGTLLVTCPAIPEVTTFGEDRNDALRYAVDAIEEAIAARIADGRDIPRPRLSARLRNNEAIVTLPAPGLL